MSVNRPLVNPVAEAKSSASRSPTSPTVRKALAACADRRKQLKPKQQGCCEAGARPTNFNEMNCPGATLENTCLERPITADSGTERNSETRFAATPSPSPSPPDSPELDLGWAEHLIKPASVDVIEDQWAAGWSHCSAGTTTTSC